MVGPNREGGLMVLLFINLFFHTELSVYIFLIIISGIASFLSLLQSNPSTHLLVMTDMRGKILTICCIFTI